MIAIGEWSICGSSSLPNLMVPSVTEHQLGEDNNGLSAELSSEDRTVYYCTVVVI